MGTNQAFLAPFGATVNTGTNAGTFANVNLGNSAGSNSGNAAFSGSSKYLLFSFNNAGNVNYGWLELVAATTGLTGGVSQYSVTLGNWAYDNSGYQLRAGEFSPVPEAGSASMTMAAALVLGAAGLRRYRKQRAALLPKDGAQG